MNGDLQQLLVRDRPDSTAERTVELNPAIVRLLPPELCRRHTLLPLSFEDGVLTVASATPGNAVAEQEIRDDTGYDVAWLTADAVDIRQAIDRSFTGARVRTGSADDLVDQGLAMPPRLGERLVQRGLITEAQLAAALEEQGHRGGRIGEVLVHGGALAEKDLQSILAEQHNLPTIDLSGFDPADAPLGVMPETMGRRLGCLPVAVADETVYVATPDGLGPEATEEISSYTGLGVQPVIAPRRDIEDLRRRVYSDAYTTTAVSHLRERHPESSAHIVLSAAQKVFFILLLLVILGFLIWKTKITLIVLFAIASIFYTANSIYKLVAAFSALGHEYQVDTSPEALAAMDESRLPMYTILVPLFDEAQVVEYLIASINEFDYPRDRLDVRLLCEEEDVSTIEAIRALNLPPHFNLVIVPPSEPQTKPKACNYGLLGARGEYVVIYDAEDRPDPQQLKKAVLMFDQADPSIACIQSKLNYYNQHTNMLTRWFSIEYSMLFDLTLPGLDARHEPIPLGGTSNHIRLDKLIEVGGWDPYNVTEDADLGVRLHQAGYRTTMMDSTTYEEANSDVGNWIRQRSRWIKGYLQTWLVYSRNPLRLFRGVGLRGFVSFHLLIGGTFIFLINPIFWFLTTLFTLTKAGFIQELFPSWVFYLAAAQLFLGNFVFTYLGLAAAARRGDDNLVPYALAFPLYWGLMSVAAWKALFQLVSNPFYWEKTEHGLDLPAGQPPAASGRPLAGSGPATGAAGPDLRPPESEAVL